MIISRIKIVRTILVFMIIFISINGLFAGASREGQQSSGTFPTGKISYPMKTDVTLTYWTGINSNIAPNFTNYNEVPFHKEWQERTGIKITYIHPPLGTENEAFNLIVASQDIPDIFFRDIFSLYPGGPEKAINDGTILKLNDLIDKYAPNLKELLSSRPDWDRMVKTDNGSYYTFPNLRSDKSICVWQGLVIREDWLNELNLQVPETFNDWYTVLTAFKTRKNSPAPLALQWNNASFMYGFGIDIGFYMDDDKIIWGRAQPAYRDYLVMMNQWYKEGLLDPDTATLTGQQINTKITNGTSGATFGAMGGGMAAWIPAGRATNPNYDILGVRAPVKNKGDKLIMINIDNPYSPNNGAVSVGGTTKNREIAARFLDWGYSQDGYMFHNFGTLGLSYNMVNGYPKYTDLILKHPQGWPIGQSMPAYMMGSYGGPHVQAVECIEQFRMLPEQGEAVANWQKDVDEPFKHKLPPITPTPEESQEAARIMNEVNTYANEMMIKYILGTEPISTFDNYISTIRRMGIDRLEAIYTAALTRYNKR